jgi:electron transport complex protein RnfC
MNTAKHTFHGGIRPLEHKEDSNTTPIEIAPIPPMLVLPLQQHSGPTAKPCVTEGEYVYKGQMIANAADASGASVHASSSGYVVAIEARLVAHPSGMADTCIVIETDGLDAAIETSGHLNWRNLNRVELLDILHRSGIVGLGGAGFPTARKLNTDSIDTLIINGTECEPYITADDLCMRERAADIIRGCEILKYIVGANSVIVGIEDNKPEAIESMGKAMPSSPDWKLVTFPTKYPSGGEKQLIEILTGRQVPRGGLPANIGIVCQNVGTAFAVKEALEDGKPLISRITTFTGQALSRRGNLEVRLGTPVSYLLDYMGYTEQKVPRLIMGGPMMGFALPDATVPIVKTTNCILAPDTNELPLPKPAQPCIRCGFCAEACPASLLPQQLFWHSKSSNFDQLDKHALDDCIECGVCSYVCPSSIPLVQYFRASKHEMRMHRNEQQQADKARERFEARQQRLEREALEREATRAARKAAAKAKAAESSRFADGADPVQAAIERAKAKKARLMQQSQQGAQMNAESALDSLKTKLAAQQSTLQQAEADGKSEKITTALQASIRRLEQQIAESETKPPSKDVEE